VASERGALVLAGRRGSGKTTAVRAGLAHGLRLVADDYLVLDASDGMAWPLYRTVSVARAGSAEKSVIHLGRVEGPATIEAVVVPRIRGGRSELARLSAAAALRAWASATALHMPYDAGAVVASIARLVRTVPCFDLEIGDGEEQLATALSGALGRTAR
jgi:hypothetical protein